MSILKCTREFIQEWRMKTLFSDHPTQQDLDAADDALHDAEIAHDLEADNAALRDDITALDRSLSEANTKRGDAERERDALRKMVNAADEMRLCLHKPIKNYADDLLDAVVAYDHARLESDAAMLAGKKP